MLILKLVFLIYLIVDSTWIDVDTLESDKVRIGYTDGNVYDLIMSDEFNKDDRSFHDGHDPTWTAIDKSEDSETGEGKRSLHFYNASHCFTKKGVLTISTTTEDTVWKGWNSYTKKKATFRKHFRSGMLQSWNKFCFTGGIVEFEAKLPGNPYVGGLWPAVWLFGNLGRATFIESTNRMWPFSIEGCDPKLQAAQEISGCDSTSDYSLHSKQGRGSTEIDILEVMSGAPVKLPVIQKDIRLPYQSMTLTIAPGIREKRPYPGNLPNANFTWYQNLSFGKDTSINPFYYGTYIYMNNDPRQSFQYDSVSAITSLDESFWTKMHKFRLEWEPGPDGYLHWYIDDEFRYGIEGESLKVTDSQIPSEPSYIILNTAISTSWGFPEPEKGCKTYDCKRDDHETGKCRFPFGFCETIPASFEIDNIRVYQNKLNPRHTVGCNPRGYPTNRFIKQHENRYKRSHDMHPLMPLRYGGALCQGDDFCGQGYCSKYVLLCVCNKGWMGPRCLTQMKQNDFEDWDKELVSDIILPNVMPFLALLLILLVVYLLIKSIWKRYSGYNNAHAYKSLEQNTSPSQNKQQIITLI